MSANPAETGYAPVSGLNMYYEIHGRGAPLVVLHGVFGDLAGMPDAQLAILPGTSHVGILDRAGWLAEMVGAFLEAPTHDPH